MKFSRFLVAACILFTAQTALATNVVVFDAQQAIMQTNSARQRMEELQKKPEYAKLVAEAEGLKADLASLSKDAESKGLTWSPEQQAEHRKNVEFVQADFKLVVQKIQKEQDDLVKSLLAEGQKMIPEALEKIVKAEAIDIVLQKQAAIWSNPSVDITAKVIAELNKAP